MKKIKETTAFYNKEYNSAVDGPFLKAIQIAFAKKIIESLGKFPDHIFYADDCFVTYRNLGFLSDQAFCDACEEAGIDQVLLGRIWRIHVLAWTLSQRWPYGGTYIDCGTYNGVAFEVALRYAQNLQQTSANARFIERRIIAADIFDTPPPEARKAEHGSDLYESVRVRLGRVCNAEVCKGELPESLNDLGALGTISWAQIDLNSAESDCAVFKYLLDHLADGAIVVFDDYGFVRYRSTQTGLDNLIAEYNLPRILELPTGQGLYMHKRAHR